MSCMSEQSLLLNIQISMFNQTELKKIIGEDIFLKIEKESEIEVALAIKMNLVDEWRQDKYYYCRKNILEIFLDECRIFKKNNLEISPIEVFHIIYRAKLLFACKTEKEFSQRAAGGFLSDPIFSFQQEEKKFGLDEVIDTHLNRLHLTISSKTVITQLSHFHTGLEEMGLGNATDFFDSLFIKLNLPFSIYLDDSRLVEKFRATDSKMRMYYSDNEAKRFFNSPSIGYTTVGTSGYCEIYSEAWLRTFLNMLRVAGFIRHGQMDFGNSEIEVMAPTSSVILGQHTSGCYLWDEDTKKPWMKLPDGCLFNSFGYRGLAKMYLDGRTFGGIEKFFIDNKVVFEYLKNPWEEKNINDIQSSLDILSSTTQIPDLGAKILLLYCCLEHLFVPKNVTKDNMKYIVGGINALKPELVPWFNRLYKVRCDYAHKGYVVTDNTTRSLVFESINNVFSLLIAKIS